MLNFIKKLFGLETRPDVHPLDGATRQAQEAPYKIEPPASTTTKIDGIGHESVPVVEEKPKKAKKPKAEKPAKVEKPAIAEKPKKPRAKKSA